VIQSFLEDSHMEYTTAWLLKALHETLQVSLTLTYGHYCLVFHAKCTLSLPSRLDQRVFLLFCVGSLIAFWSFSIRSFWTFIISHRFFSCCRWHDFWYIRIHAFLVAIGLFFPLLCHLFFPLFSLMSHGESKGQNAFISVPLTDCTHSSCHGSLQNSLEEILLFEAVVLYFTCICVSNCEDHLRLLVDAML
jgi:hypothetical protein